MDTRRRQFESTDYADSTDDNSGLSTQDFVPLPLRICTRASCGGPVDPKRVARGSCFCSNECRSEDKRERAAHRASITCYACGRKKRRIRLDEGKRTAHRKAPTRDGHRRKQRPSKIAKGAVKRAARG